MERKCKKEELGNILARISGLNFLDIIEEYVKREREKTQLNYDEFLSSLKRWWCHHYSRPYKDPLLSEYSIEDLYYEYCSINYKQLEQKNIDKLPQEEWDWAEEEEQRERAEEEERNSQTEFKNDIIQEDDQLTDEDWANKHDNPDIKINPSAQEIDEGGDICANFGDLNE